MGAIGQNSSLATAQGLVVNRFSTSESLVNAYNAASNSAISALAAGNYSIPTENLDLGIDDISVPPIGEAPIPNVVDGYESQLQEVTLDDIAVLRAQLGLVEATYSTVTLPVLEAQPPSVSIPITPDSTIPDIPDNIPSVSSPDIPTAPTLDIPTVPTLEEIALPSAPVLSNYTFDATVPTADLTPPEPMFVYSEATYQSDLADAIKTKLYTDVVVGGTGLGADVEEALWNRALSRLDIELEKAYSQILNNWEQWNFEMPDGLLSAALQEALNDDARNRLDYNRDLTFKQADLAQQNTQFAITNGLEQEKQLMAYTNVVNQRAFEVARYRVQAVVEAFNVKVSAYNAQMEGYRVQAQVFESQIRAELQKVEVYKAELEGAKIKGDLQAQKVEIYARRVSALNTLIDLYRAQMDGAKIQADIDKVKIDAARARIDAAVAQIQGVTAKFNLYQMQIAGESAKVDLYGKQVDAYSKQVDAAKVESDINVAEMQATLENNKDRVSVLMAAIDKYKADTQYEVSREDAAVKAYVAQTDQYTAEVRREQEYIRSKIALFGEQIRGASAEAELLVKEMDANLRAMAASKEISERALEAVAQMYTQKVASALTSVSASAQLGVNAGLNWSDVNTYSSSYSNSTSTTESDITTTNSTTITNN